MSDSAIQFFENLKGWATGEFTTRDATQKESASRSSVYSRLSELHDAGAVEQVEAGRGRTPAKWKLSGREPDPGAAVLPTVKAVFPDLHPARNRESNTQPSEAQGV
ncbi:MAG: hypothetical protein C0501_06970 [Isosphaera sp.]|nr:hypothetical protein [Isosphaera sp.]